MAVWQVRQVIDEKSFNHPSTLVTTVKLLFSGAITQQKSSNKKYLCEGIAAIALKWFEVTASRASR